jgi:uncharacterized integral membrane protein (TIGR00698 family)
MSLFQQKPDESGGTWLGKISRPAFIVAVLFCLTPLITPPLALLGGLVFANTLGNPFKKYNSKASKWLLQISVVGLGFGMNAMAALRAGKTGILFTVVSIFGTLALGYIFGRWMKMDKKTTQLISAGTAICGGSAIAAVAPVIEAEEKQISVALGIVFILNSIALFLFPVLGHLLHLSETQFGMWAAIAIHDTSSVVGAAGRYGPQALLTATTVKLARALWIIPVSLGMAALRKKGSGKVKIPWFIFLFVIAMLLNSYVPPINAVSAYIVMVAKAGLTLTLFLIGAGLSLSSLRSVGLKPFVLGIILWVIISVAALGAVLNLIN